MLGLALSGGGSKSIAFHLGCMRSLNTLGLLEKVDIISCVSGGSLIGAYYAYNPDIDFIQFEKDIKIILCKGLQYQVILGLLNIGNWFKRAAFATNRFRYERFYQQEYYDFFGRSGFNNTDIFERELMKIYGNLTLSSKTKNNIKIIINSCDINTETAFRFCDKISGSTACGLLNTKYDIPLTLAVSASSAYPLLLPSIKRTWRFIKDESASNKSVLLVDGGVYDNLGLQVFEPNREKGKNLHVYPCEYIISCNADTGKDLRYNKNNRTIKRLIKSISIIHRREQEATVQRFYEYKDKKIIKGLLYLYLGQNDTKLPCIIPDKIKRDNFIDYPIDFKPMSMYWVDKISERGEFLTNCLAQHYLRELF